MKLAIALLLLVSTTVNGFATVRPTALLSSGLRTTRSSLYMQSNNNYNKDSTNNNININNNIKNTPTAPLSAPLKSALAAVMCAFSLMAFPSDSFAARSGGRSGGSSFRAPSAPRSSTRMNAGGGGYGGGGGGYRTSYAPSPIIIGSPFGFSPFGYGYGGGFGFSPFSFINPQVLFLGLGAYAIYSVLNNRVGGSDFSNDGSDSRGGSLGSGASVIKLQVSLDADWAKNGNIMQTLADLSSRRGVVTGRSEISALVSDAALTLLRTSPQWNSASFNGQAFGGGKAESYFQNLAVAERAKFDRENAGAGTSTSILNGRPTQAVVSLIVAVRGKSDALARDGVSSVSDVKQILQILASEALTDDGENIMGVELLWTPSEAGDVLTEREVVEDYPELMRL